MLLIAFVTLADRRASALLRYTVWNEMKYLLRSLYRSFVRQHQVSADHSYNIPNSASAISYSTYSNLSLKFYSTLQMIHSWFYSPICI
jgi:hypothetical protein